MSFGIICIDKIREKLLTDKIEKKIILGVKKYYWNKGILFFADEI